MKIKPNVAISENGFVFNSTSGDTFTVNSTGKVILDLLNKGSLKEEIVEAIVQQFDVTQETASNNFDDFILLLSQYNLLESNFSNL